MKLESQLLVALITNLPFAMQTYSKRLHILETVVRGESLSFKELYDKTAESFREKYSDDYLEMWRIEHWRSLFPTPAVYVLDVWLQALAGMVVAYILTQVRTQGLL
jgi:hypothetical protein